MLEQSEARRTTIASSIVVSGGVSIGYVVWLVRGGVLMSSMLSALPAWQMIDPMPVLAAARKAKVRRGAAATEDGDVERLFDGGSRAGTPQPVHAQAPAGDTSTPVQDPRKPRA